MRSFALQPPSATSDVQRRGDWPRQAQDLKGRPPLDRGHRLWARVRDPKAGKAVLRALCVIPAAQVSHRQAPPQTVGATMLERQVASKWSEGGTLGRCAGTRMCANPAAKHSRQHERCAISFWSARLTSVVALEALPAVVGKHAVRHVRAYARRP